jgi:iron(III) transport system ATP-binding protein
MPGIIKSRQFLGKFINYFVDFGTKNLTEVSVNTNSANMIFSPGEKIWMRVDSERVNLFAKDSETTLMEGVQSHV